MIRVRGDLLLILAGLAVAMGPGEPAWAQAPVIEQSGQISESAPRLPARISHC